MPRTLHTPAGVHDQQTGLCRSRRLLGEPCTEGQNLGRGCRTASSVSVITASPKHRNSFVIAHRPWISPLACRPERPFLVYDLLVGWWVIRLVG